MSATNESGPSSAVGGVRGPAYEGPWDAADAWAPADAGAPRVDVFRSRVESAERDEAEWLSNEERERAARFVHAEARDRFVTGRTALRALLSRIVDCAPGEVPLATGAHGKPEIPDALSRGFAFNLSHTDDCVMAAVAPVERIGIDVEPVRESVEFERLARRVLAQSERDALPEDEATRRVLFYRLWASKEAYLKAWGTGLSFGASRCEMRIAADEAVALVASEMAGEDPSRWHFVEIEPGDGLKACVCWPGEALAVRGWQLTRDTLPALARSAG